MARSAVPPSRGFAEWSVRGCLALFAAILGYVSISYTLGYAARNASPEYAYSLAGGDGRVAAMLARQLSGPEVPATDRRRADRLAREALRRDPTAVNAVSVLGVSMVMRRDLPAAHRLFTYAEQLSRRDLQTQLWAVEDAVGRGDTAAAVRHHDIALRTTRDAADLLFPILASALVEPQVRAELAKALAMRPAWGKSFVEYAAANGPDPLATASLFQTLKRRGIVVAPNAQSAVINTLVSRGFVEAGWSYYASVRPGADRKASRDHRFTADPTAPSPFDWVPVSEGGTNTSIQQAGNGGIVDFSAPASIGGPLLQQMQVLSPGKYRLEGHSIGIDQPPDARPYWVLICVGGSELGRADLPNSAQDDGRFTGYFIVPPGCLVQTLALVARPSDAVGGLSGQIDRVRLAAAR